ncbi:crosslink repair DNA glycosylase YcaQ family protein [Mesorhizobium sp. VK23B]|uniref:Crosslink repair DNA glycosylase YcaQ family protein n=1 Tax=Mesorhizobium dulcispinae TaxID=3072316 RepID=A0ABU4XS39_9HYPH|nr:MULTISPECIES: crosslink repair DNA glycosylase YcaQ family protein [unclassified Mesorhizobium]MDX8470285.1 crosslink repair DNA glycosylase YcaQ family protein [Mesorhizobium sp. VK23B]MDX8476660.1 crosslink repair DNA glycosylase YcaQ family protein [Mesorhizobium sp. VK23A]
MAKSKAPSTHPISKQAARLYWLAAQGLVEPLTKLDGAAAVHALVKHLGYVQIDAINVVERAHHHVLWTRHPAYRRVDVERAQSVDKTIFEYWTHALAFVPTEDYRYFMPAMAARRKEPHHRFANVSVDDMDKLLERIKKGPLSISDIDDDVLVEKDHAWASRKPSRRVLSLAFYTGDLTISSRVGIVKTYDLTARHFGWKQQPRPAGESEVNAYMLDRALRSQRVVSLDSVCYLEPSRKPAMKALIDKRVANASLVPVLLEGDRTPHWATAELLDLPVREAPLRATVLSPFDPLIIQRKRLEMLFGYKHLFEAYLPAAKRVLGYFALPVLYGDRIVAAIDAKADRQAKKLIINKRTDFGSEDADQRQAVEVALGAFEAFQFSD